MTLYYIIVFVVFAVLGSVIFMAGYVRGFSRAHEAEKAIRASMANVTPPVEELLFFHDPESLVNGEYDIYLAKMVDPTGEPVAVLDLDRAQMREIRDGITQVLRLGSKHDTPGSA